MVGAGEEPEHTMTEEEVMRTVGREGCGYGSTPCDGDCTVVAVMQTILRQAAPLLPEETVLKAALDAVPAVRKKVAEVLHEDEVLRAAREAPELRREFIVAMNSKVEKEHKLAPDATEEQVAALVRRSGSEGGPWFFPLLHSALAMAVNRDIAVVMGPSVTVFPKKAGRYVVEEVYPIGAWATTAFGMYKGKKCRRTCLGDWRTCLDG